VFVLVRAVTYATLFIGLLLVFVPARLLSRSGVSDAPAIGIAQAAGILAAAIGAALALWCILTFALFGKGTPAPFDPPRRLVVRGPYRYVRNPMYLGAATALAGAALCYQSAALAAYAGGFPAHDTRFCRVVRGTDAPRDIRSGIRELLPSSGTMVAKAEGLNSGWTDAAGSKNSMEANNIHGRPWSMWLAVALAALVSPRAEAQARIDAELLREASGQFEFRNDPGRQPMTVWYCRPATLGPDTRVVFLMHGGDPQTARQACTVAGEYPRAHDVLILAPQFSEDSYPGDSYMFGAMTGPDGSLLPSSQWGFMAVERLFDAVRSGMELRSSTYDIVGFSGGGQFVHRLVLFVPNARFRRAVAGSPARYAFPTTAVPFPYGLGGSSVGASQLRAAFARDFILLLGDGDTVDRERETAAMAQGTNRFARGLRFFAVATEEAGASGAPLAWRLRILPGVDHDPARVVRAALELLQ